MNYNSKKAKRLYQYLHLVYLGLSYGFAICSAAFLIGQYVFAEVNVLYESFLLLFFMIITFYLRVNALHYHRLVVGMEARQPAPKRPQVKERPRREIK